MQGIIEFPQRRKFRVTAHFDSLAPPHKRHKP
jgi:hypothetical protein